MVNAEPLFIRQHAKGVRLVQENFVKRFVPLRLMWFTFLTTKSQNHEVTLRKYKMHRKKSAPSARLTGDWFLWIALIYAEIFL